MMVIAHLLGFALIFIACTFDFMRLALMPKKIQYVLDIPSLIIVVLPTIYYAVSVHGWKSYGNSWKALLGSVKNIDKSQLEPTKLCLRDLGNLSLIWGILGTFVGTILMLREMESALSQDTLFPAVAISLITLFYGIILYMLCLVSNSRIERRLVE
ncbi:MAG: hypothetical protein CBB81_01305 [Cellvibrionales bacterium TMED21]|nr:MAG: hypothetical protein CBB81_01305 [Cellvibrionales bacterium TMED21]